MKYVTRIKRFHLGQYINASAEHPVVIDVPDGVKPDAELRPVEDDAPQPSASRSAPDTFAPSELLSQKVKKSHERN